MEQKVPTTRSYESRSCLQSEDPGLPGPLVLLGARALLP